MVLFSRVATVLLLLLLLPMQLGGQSVHEMMAKEEEEREARMEARMQAQWQAMTGGVEASEQQQPRLPSATEGGIPEPPPPPKQIGVKTARSFMKDILSALTTEDAKTALELARKEVPVSTNDATHWQTLVRTLGPELEKRTTAIVQRYGFASDFEKAMASVGEAQQRKGDKELASAMLHLNELFTGERAEMPDVGVVPDLAQVADGFLDASDQEREHGIELSSELRKKTKDARVQAHIDMYLEVMRGIQTDGENFVENGISTILSAAKEDAQGAVRTFHERERLEVRTNILVQFLRANERRRLAGEPVADSKAEL